MFVHFPPQSAKANDRRRLVSLLADNCHVARTTRLSDEVPSGKSFTRNFSQSQGFTLVAAIILFTAGYTDVYATPRGLENLCVRVVKVTSVTRQNLRAAATRITCIA